MTVFTVVLPLLEKAINRYLQLDSESPERLAALSGRVMAVEMQGLGASFYMRATPEKITLADHLQGTTDNFRGFTFFW